MSIAELLIKYAHMLTFNNPTLTIYDNLKMMIDNLDIDYDDKPVVIHDTIISYFEHNRVNRPNVDDTFGLFGITDEAYRSCECLKHEYERCVEYQTLIHSDGSPTDIV